MDWLAVSELNFGRLLKGEISPTRFNRQMFYPPYDRGFALLEKGKAAVIKEVGIDRYQSALHSVEELNGAGNDVDWAEMLEKAAVSWSLADEFERINKKLRDNQEPDFSKIMHLQERYQQGLASRFVTLDEIWDEEPVEEWQKSGLAFLDYWLGGIPRYGLWTVGGVPKGGKTSFAMGLVIGYVKTHKKRSVAIYTVEMMNHQFKKRLREMETAGSLTTDERKRIYLCDDVLDEAHAVNWASSLPDVGLIIIDFADLLVQGEVTEPKMSALYRTLANGAKSLKTSICLLAQLSGSYTGGLPRPHHIRYTRLSEALVVLNLMLYVGWRGWYETKETDILPIYNDSGYIIKWMSRYKTAKNVGIPVAISVKFDTGGGWDITDRGESFLING